MSKASEYHKFYKDRTLILDFHNGQTAEVTKYGGLEIEDDDKTFDSEEALALGKWLVSMFGESNEPS